MVAMPHIEVDVIDSKFSDHSPLSFKFAENRLRKPRPFKFINHLVGHQDFFGKGRESGIVLVPKSYETSMV